MISPDAAPPGGWKFKTALSPAGKDLVEKWLGGLPAAVRREARMRLVSRLDRHRLIARRYWGKPQFSELSAETGDGEQIELSEFAFTVGEVQCRVLGFFGPAPDEYTLLAGATKSGKKGGKSKGASEWNPDDAPGEAAQRKAAIEDGQATGDFDVF